MQPKRGTPPRVVAAVRSLQIQVRPVEARYITALRKIMGGFHAAFMDYLEPAIVRAVQGTPRTDADDLPAIRASSHAGRDIDTLSEHLIPQLGPKVNRAHVVMVDALTAVQKKTLGTIFPIDFTKQPPAVQAALRISRDASIGLVEDAARAYASQVRAIFDDPAQTVGRRVEDLRDDLFARGGVSESRAALIARDQTLKLNGMLNRAHQVSNGVDRYKWSTSGDERVRETHADLDGDDFAWDSPPDIERDDGSSEALNPGEDYQCRCIAIPIIPDLDDI